jgi:pimeloyl-ACP methyl ester carboxylesterase
MIEAEPTQLSFEVNGITFAAQAWGNPEGLPVLALHGWLDNSASFYALAPRLHNIYLVALDMAGHGRSGHRPGSGPYNIWEDVSEIFAIADALGWDRFALLGHSRGAIIAALAAGTFPERITHLGLIEGLLPEQVTADSAPQQLARSIQETRAQAGKSRTVYPDFSTAVKARERGLFPLGPDAAKALTQRGLITLDSGYQWGTDQRLLLPSAIKLIPEQLAAFINRISAPIMLVLAENGMPKLHPVYAQKVAAFPQVNIELLPGGHHLHMEQQAVSVAAIFNTFFANAQ